MELQSSPEEYNESGSWRGPMKMVKVRDYSQGSLRDRVCRAESEEEVMALGALAQALYEEGRLSGRSWEKFDRAAQSRLKKLRGRLIQPMPLLVAPDGSRLA